MYLYFTNVKNENTDDNKELIEIIKNGTSYSGIGNLLFFKLLWEFIGNIFFFTKTFFGKFKNYIYNVLF
jgi:hypothetical protein